MADEMDMVGRVARAICAADDESWTALAAMGREAPYLVLARAAIEAMREPDLRMIVAARNAGVTDWATTKVTFTDDATPIWHAMIDAALSPETEARDD